MLFRSFNFHMTDESDSDYSKVDRFIYTEHNIIIRCTARFVGKGSGFLSFGVSNLTPLSVPFVLADECDSNRGDFNISGQQKGFSCIHGKRVFHAPTYYEGIVMVAQSVIDLLVDFGIIVDEGRDVGQMIKNGLDYQPTDKQDAKDALKSVVDNLQKQVVFFHEDKPVTVDYLQHMINLNELPEFIIWYGNTKLHPETILFLDQRLEIVQE